MNPQLMNAVGNGIANHYQRRIPKGIGLAVLSGLGKIRPRFDRLQVVKPDLCIPFHEIGILIGRPEVQRADDYGKVMVDFDTYGRVSLPICALREPARLECFLDPEKFADGYMKGFAARHSTTVLPDFRDTDDPQKLGMLKGWADATASTTYRADRGLRFFEPYNDVARAFLLPDNAAGARLASETKVANTQQVKLDTLGDWREITARYNSNGHCGHIIHAGQKIGFDRGRTKCEQCWQDHKEARNA